MLLTAILYWVAVGAVTLLNAAFAIVVVFTIGFLGVVGFVIVAHAAWSWLRTWAYRHVIMLGSSTRDQFRSVLYKVFVRELGVVDRRGYFREELSDTFVDNTSTMDPRKFCAILAAYERVFFWKVKDGEMIDFPVRSNLTDGGGASIAKVKRRVLIVIDNDVHLSDTHLSCLTGALLTFNSVERIYLILPRSQYPKYFLEGGFPPPCLQCSAAKAGRAFEGEDDNGSETYIVDSYHIEHAGSTVTAMVVYEKEHYGTKFVGISIDRNRCVSRPTVERVDEPALVMNVTRSSGRNRASPETQPGSGASPLKIRQNSAPNLDVLKYLPRIAIDSSALVSRKWCATVVQNSKSLTLHSLAEVTINKDGSSRCAYKLDNKRLLFRSSATVILNAMRNSHIKQLRIENARGNLFVELTEFIADSNVTAVETTLALPTFLSTNGTATTQASPELIGKLVKQIRSEQLALTFDGEERDYSVIGLAHFKEQLRALRIVITNDHLPSFEIARLIFSERSANVHLTLSTLKSAHFLATFFDDVLKQCTYETLHGMTSIRVAVGLEAVYDTPTWLVFVKEFASNDWLRLQFSRSFFLRVRQCRVYELRRQKGESYTVVISREPKSPETDGNHALQVFCPGEDRLAWRVNKTNSTTTTCFC